MMKLRTLLDKIYELEGLVHLAMRRGEEESDFIRLICRKAIEIQDISRSLNYESPSDSLPEDNLTNIEKPEEAEILSEKIIAQDDYEDSPDEDEGYKNENELMSEEKIELGSEIQDGGLSTEYSFDDYEIYDIEDNGIEEISEEQTGQIRPTEEEIETEKEIARGKLVFSINDRYRFRKELFENSDAAFNTSLALVASMENYEEAEDYFINDVGMNSGDSLVQEFLDIIRRYFR